MGSGLVRRAIVLIASALAAATTPSLVAATGAAAQGGGAPRIVSQTPVEIADTRILGLSPDGRWLLGHGEDEICAIDAATVATTGCAPFPRGVDEDNVAWSSDGSRVAITENAAQYLFDGDLWVFDLTTATLTNLTDDGYDGSLIEDEAPIPLLVDINPAWSPDGETLAFARSEFRHGDDTDIPYTTQIYTIPAAGGAPTRITQISPEPLAAYPGIRWSPAGDEVVVGLASLSEGPADGLWAVEIATGKTRPIYRADPERWPARLLDVSAAGVALLSYFDVSAPDADGSYFELVDIESGEVRALAPSPLWEGAGVDRAAFSPDGSRLLYTVPMRDHLVIRDLATGEETDLLADLPAGERPGILGFRLSWAATDLLYVSATPSAGTLVQIDGG